MTQPLDHDKLIAWHAQLGLKKDLDDGLVNGYLYLQTWSQGREPSVDLIIRARDKTLASSTVKVVALSLIAFLKAEGFTPSKLTTKRAFKIDVLGYHAGATFELPGLDKNHEIILV